MTYMVHDTETRELLAVGTTRQQIQQALAQLDIALPCPLPRKGHTLRLVPPRYLEAVGFRSIAITVRP